MGSTTTPAAVQRDRAGRAPSRAADRWAWLAGVLVVATAHARVSLDAVAPVQTKDEIGYLAAARWLATGEGAGLLTPDYAGGYAVGWGLLTAPLWALTQHPPTVYAASVAVNVVLAVVLLLPATAVARRLGLGTPAAVLVATVVCLGAGRLGYTGYALPETLLTLQLTTSLWLLLRLWDPAADQGRRRGAWRPELLGLAALLAWLPTTHARTLPLALLGLVSLASWARARRSPPAGLAAGLGLAGVAAGWWLNGHVERVLYGDVARTAVAAEQVGGLRVPDVLALVAGHAWYAAAAWLGLALLGWWAAVALAPAELRARGLGPWTWLVLGSVAQLGVGAAYLSTRLDVGARVDQLVYGRYGDPVWFVLALVGTAVLLARRSPGRLLALAAATLVLLSAAALVALRANADRAAGFVQLNVPGLEAWAWRDGDVFVVPWAQATALAVVVLALTAVAALRGRPAGPLRLTAVGCVGVVLLGAAVVAERRNIEPRDAWIRQLFGVAELVRAEPDLPVVLLVDRPLLLSGNAMQWWLADRDPTVVDGTVVPPSSGARLVVGPSSAPPRPGSGTAVLLGTDVTGSYGVWRLDG